MNIRTRIITILVGLMFLIISSSLANTFEMEIIVKFKSRTVEIPQGQKEATIENLNKNRTELKKYFNGISDNIKFEKLIPKAQSSDTIYVNKKNEIKKLNDWSQVFKVTIQNSAKNITDIIKDLNKMDKVEYAEPPAQIFYNETPDDLHKELQQWYLPKINAEDAWEITTGSSSIKIAVIERGVASHTDVNDKLTGGDSGSINNHGLMVAGVAGCETDNSIGLASLGYNIMIIPKNVSTSSITQAILEAADPTEDDADIINCSFKTIYYPNPSEFYSYNFSSVEDAIEDAITWGKVVVAVAGNPPYGDDQDEVPHTIWPAAYTGVIGVSATDSTDTFPSGYNYGSYVDVCAPGIDISVLDLSNQYSTSSGTSFSAPLVSALAALILSNDNTLTPEDIQEVIEMTVDDCGTNGYDYYYGHGRINAYTAVKNLYVPEIYSTIQAALDIFRSNQEIIMKSSHGLTKSYQLSSGESLSITSSAVLNLNNYNIQSGNGTLDIEEGATIVPDIRIYSGTTIKGLFSTLSSALTAASSGDSVYIKSNYTVSGSNIIPSGITLILESGITSLATGASIVSSSGSIDIDGATVSPNIQVNASGTIYGLYKTVQAALTACSSGLGNVRVYGGTFEENLSIPSGKGLYGYGNVCIDGNVTFSSCSGSDISGIQVDGVLQISYGNYVYLENLIISNGRIDVDCGSGHTIDNVEFTGSAYIDIYQSSPEIYDVGSTNSTSYSVYANQASPDICSGSFSYKTNAVYCASYADATVDGNFCNNTYDIFAGTGSDVDATGVNTFSDSDSADCIHTSGSPV